MKKKILLIIYVLSPLIPGTILYLADTEKYSDNVLLAGMVLGVCAFTWLTAELFIIARIRFIENIFGLDILFRFHGYMAIAAILLSIIHRFLEESIFGSILTGTIGDIALLLFFAVGLMSMLFLANTFVSALKPVVKLKRAVHKISFFGYELQLFIHNFSIIALAVLYVHLMLTSSAAEHLSVKALYSVMFFSGLSFYFYHKVVKRILLHKNRYRVKEIVRENETVWTLSLVPEKGKVFDFKPGQFGFLRLYGKGIPREEHPFSISSDPEDKKHITVTIKELGNYTAVIKNTKPGFIACIDAPYGSFSYLNHPEETETVLIAGGVGITPALSMLRYMRSKEKNRNVTLIWGLGNKSDLMRTDEINEMKKEMKHLHVVPVMFRDEMWEGEKGLIDHILISRLLKQKGHTIDKAGFYICGPAPMLRLVLKSLKVLNIKRSQIHYERFTM